MVIFMTRSTSSNLPIAQGHASTPAPPQIKVGAFFHIQSNGDVDGTLGDSERSGSTSQRPHAYPFVRQQFTSWPKHTYE